MYSGVGGGPWAVWQDANIPWHTGGSFMEDPAAASDWLWMRATARNPLANGFWVLTASITRRVPVRLQSNYCQCGVVCVVNLHSRYQGSHVTVEAEASRRTKLPTNNHIRYVSFLFYFSTNFIPRVSAICFLSQILPNSDSC